MATLGSLYNAHTESVITMHLFRGALPPGFVETTQCHTVDIGVGESDSYEDKLRTFSMDTETAASCLVGLVCVGGAAQYLSDKRVSDRVVHSSLNCKSTTVREVLDLTASSLKKELAPDMRDPSITIAATHIVPEITWGSL